MKLMLKIFGLAVCLALLFSSLYVIWGPQLESTFGDEAFFSGFTSTAWLVADGLLVADLVLPIPATPIMAALGAVYGPLAGTAFAVIGSATAGIAGYWLAKACGNRGVRFIADERELARFQAFFEAWGPYAVILSRALPIMPEVISILAGLSRMSFRKFLISLLAGTIPVAAVLAWSGHLSRDHAWYAVLLATVLPAVLWPLVFRPFVIKSNVRCIHDPEE